MMADCSPAGTLEVGGGSDVCALMGACVLMGALHSACMCSHGCALARLGSELLGFSTVEQCEVQVGHRYSVPPCSDV